MRIFLIGYMGSGKTTIGNLLAEVLSIPFYDTDEEIEKQTHRDIASIFKQSGEPHFRALERSTLEWLISEHENAVIATGGGLPCNDVTISAMLNAGSVIYLDCDASTLFKRIAFYSNSRPLAPPSEEELSLHLSSRLKYYLRAHLIIDGSNTIETILKEISNFINPIS